MGEQSSFSGQATIQISTALPHTDLWGALVARLGGATLERAVARPRAQPGYLLLATAREGPIGHALIAHVRRGLGAARLDVAALELAADTPAAAEPLLAAAVAAAAEAELPFLTLRGAPADFAAYGLAPSALASQVGLAAADLTPSPAFAAAHPWRLRPAAAADADDLGALAGAALADQPLGPRRSPPDWRWLLDEPEGWLVLEDRRGRPAAYARLDGDVVIEAAAADAGAARGLVAALSAAGAATLALPLSNGVARAALLLGGTATTRAREAGQPAELWGVIDLSAALGAVASELTRRLALSRYAGWSGAVRLEGAAGAATLRCVAGQVTADAVPGPVDVMVGGLGLAAAAQLILGYRQAADLRASGELRCADVDLGLLDALFPAL